MRCVTGSLSANAMGWQTVAPADPGNDARLVRHPAGEHIEKG
jgi:hypothetical protein